MKRIMRKKEKGNKNIMNQKNKKEKGVENQGNICTGKEGNSLSVNIMHKANRESMSDVMKHLAHTLICFFPSDRNQTGLGGLQGDHKAA